MLNIIPVNCVVHVTLILYCYMKRNLTIQLDEATIRKARIVAAKRSLSISRLVTEVIEQAARKEESLEMSKKTALKLLDKQFNLGTNGKLSARESLYGR